MNITRMQVNHITNPLGFDLGEKPTFSWVVEDARGTAAVASRVVVRCGKTVIADTGWADLDSKACALDVPLAPRTRYEWSVSVRTDVDEEATSESAWFETAKMDEPWEADWITCDYAEPRHPVFSRRLGLVRDDVVAARLYICGLGLYEVQIMGCPLVDECGELLAPGTHAYDQWLQYQTYDVTELLQLPAEDDDRICVTLGHGWYSGRFGFVLSDEGCYGDDWRLIAELRVRYADGSEQVVGTDDSWQVTRSNIVFSNIYDGERVDATLLPVPPMTAELLDEDAAVEASAKLHARLSLPVVAHETFVPTVLHTSSGECVLDLGQNIAGSFRMVLRHRGSVLQDEPVHVHLQFGELLQDGNFYRDNLRTAQAAYDYVGAIPAGASLALRPHFTFYGYRYVKVEIDGRAPAHFDPADFAGIALYSDFDAERGRIVTGNAKVNQLISNARWGMKDNFLDTPTDCPQRDERMGWTGDANVFSNTALLMAAPYAFYRKYLYDMALEQDSMDGAMPMVVPSCGLKGGWGLPGAPAVWADVTTFLPWNMYQADGDPAILAEHYDAMRAYVDWCYAYDGGEAHVLKDSVQLADWLALDTKDPAGCKGYTDGGFVAYLYLWKSADIVADTARLLGRTDDAAYYHEVAGRVRDWIVREYFTPTGRCAVNTMTAYVLCLSFGFGNQEWAKAQLVKMLKEEGGLVTGFVGTPLLCPALSEAGLDDMAYDLLLKEDYPSWLYCVNLGATTIWERWNSLDDNGRITGTDMNSLNHYSYGSIVEWIFGYAAGLRATAPGFARARIAPRPHWRLGSIEAELDSAAGTWRVAWECVDENHLRVQVMVPFGAAAEVVLPLAPESAYEQLGGHVLVVGSYEVAYQTTAPLRVVPCVDWTIAQILDNEKASAVARGFVDGYEYAMMTSDPSLTLREAQAVGLGQNHKMTRAELEELDVALRALAE